MVLLALLVISSPSFVSAQSTATCSKATTTLQAASDGLSLPSGCLTLTDSVTFASGFQGTVELDGLKEIQSSLIINNVTQLLTLSSASLHTIARTFALSHATILSTIDFGRLTTISRLDLYALPNSQVLDFLQRLQDVTRLSYKIVGLGNSEGLIWRL